MGLHSDREGQVAIAELDRRWFEAADYRAMTWTEPQFEEISLGCEINSYACAEI